MRTGSWWLSGAANGCHVVPFLVRRAGVSLGNLGTAGPECSAGMRWEAHVSRAFA